MQLDNIKNVIEHDLNSYSLYLNDALIYHHKDKSINVNKE